MHTAICTFEDRADADRAVERLLQSGFDRHDVHLEYLHADGTPMREGQDPLMHGEPAAAGQSNDNWDGMEREVAMDSKVVRRLGNFFERLFGHDEGDRAGNYAAAYDRGHCVVFVDATSDEQAERAQSLLHGMNPDDLNVYPRTGQRPLRDVVAERQAASGSLEQRPATARAGMAAGRDLDAPGEGELPRDEAARERDRAVASQGWGEQRTLDLVEDDKPIASPDLRSPPARGDKPR